MIAEDVRGGAENLDGDGVGDLDEVFFFADDSPWLEFERVWDWLDEPDDDEDSHAMVFEISPPRACTSNTSARWFLERPLIVSAV